MPETDPPSLRVPFATVTAPTAERGSAGRIGPLRCANGRPARDETFVRLRHDGIVLSVRFECADRHVFSTFTKRDDPLWQEEAVEVFLAPGRADPTEYFEFEVSPAGILFDARVRNPHSRRDDMVVDPSWDCPGIEWGAGKLEPDRGWWAELRIPLSALSVPPIPQVWRANLYRIERPEGEPPEFTCWSPTLTDPPDFHKPRQFGVLELGD